MKWIRRFILRFSGIDDRVPRERRQVEPCVVCGYHKWGYELGYLAEPDAPPHECPYARTEEKKVHEPGKVQVEPHSPGTAPVGSAVPFGRAKD